MIISPLLAKSVQRCHFCDHEHSTAAVRGQEWVRLDQGAPAEASGERDGTGGLAPGRAEMPAWPNDRDHNSSAPSSSTSGGGVGQGTAVSAAGDWSVRSSWRLHVM